jgi:3-hydroxyisobutyrate dehydrogenase-like beta-hydroxyacid dehydrogenase
MSDLPNAQPVTVIGLGPMGQAMVRVLLAAGHPVTVWNRTPSRAADVVAAGATLATTPVEAVQRSRLVILSLTDYQAMYDILGPALDVAADALRGGVVANLSSDTPEASRRASSWAAGHGARFITAGVMVPAPLVGAHGAYVYYSGDREAFAEHEATLRLIGAPRYVGEDAALAQLYYQAQLTVILTALSGLLQATALVDSAGVSPREFVPEAFATLADIAEMSGGGDETARQLDSGSHPGNLATAVMMGATADHIVAACEAAGIDVALPLAVKSHYDRAIAAGHGQDNWTSLFEVIKRPHR